MKVDVVIPVYRDVDMTRACARSVLELGGPLLGKVWLVNDASPEPGMSGALSALAREDARVEVLTNEANLGFVRTANRGLGLCPGDVVLLNSDTRVTPGWLDELAAVAASSDRVAAVVPLSNNATLCAVPEFCGEARPEEVPVELLRLAEAEPRVTELPTGVGFCLYLKRAALSLLGPLDPAYGRGYHEENDWCVRARGRGLSILRANRAFVYHLGSASFGDERGALDRRNAERLVRRYPDYLESNRAFAAGPSAHVAALRAGWLLGRRRVCVWGEPEPLVDALRSEGLEATCGLPPGEGPWPHVCHVAAPVDDEETFRRLLRCGHLVVRAEAVVAAESMSPRARRLTGWLARAAQVVAAGTRASRHEASRLLGSTVTRWAEVPGVVRAAEPEGRAGGDFLAAIRGDGRGELELILQAWAMFLGTWRQPGAPPSLRLSGPTGGLDGVVGVVRESGLLPLRGARGWLAPVPRWDWPAEALEATAAGVPVVATASGALPELLGPEGACWMEDWSAEALAQSMKRLCGEPAYGAGVSESGRVRTGALSAGACARALSGLFEAVVLHPAEEALGLHAALCAAPRAAQQG